MTAGVRAFASKSRSSGHPPSWILLPLPIIVRRLLGGTPTCAGLFCVKVNSKPLYALDYTHHANLCMMLISTTCDPTPRQLTG